MATIAFSGCSNPVNRRESKLAELIAVFESTGHRVDTRMLELFADHEQHAGERLWRIHPRARGELINELFADDAVDAVFDITGGDLANEVLGYLDWSLIAAHPKPFVGYSDLSTLVNAIPAMTGRTATLWNPWTALERGAGDVVRILSGEPIAPRTDRELPRLPIVGGNVRCLAKLCGTPWWPRRTDSYLVLLEGMATSLAAVATYTEQLRQAGLFDEAAGLILGQFTDIDKAGERAAVVCALAEITGLEVWHAPDIGHSRDAAPVTIG